LGALNLPQNWRVEKGGSGYEPKKSGADLKWKSQNEAKDQKNPFGPTRLGEKPGRKPQQNWAVMVLK